MRRSRGGLYIIQPGRKVRRGGGRWEGYKGAASLQGKTANNSAAGGAVY